MKFAFVFKGGRHQLVVLPLFLFFFGVLLMISLVSASNCPSGIGYCNPSLPFLNPEPTTTTTSTTNYSLVNVNNSLYWQGHTGTDGSWLTNILFNYNHTADVYTIWGKWFYNQTVLSSGSYNATYNTWSYNQTYSGSTYNISYNGAIQNATYLQMYNLSYQGSIQNATYLSNWNVSYQGSLNNASYLSTYNSTYDASSFNSTWNETYANSRYAKYNFTTNNFNGSGNFRTTGQIQTSLINSTGTTIDFWDGTTSRMKIEDNSDGRVSIIPPATASYGLDIRPTGAGITNQGYTGMYFSAINTGASSSGSSNIYGADITVQNQIGQNTGIDISQTRGFNLGVRSDRAISGTASIQGVYTHGIDITTTGAETITTSNPANSFTFLDTTGSSFSVYSNRVYNFAPTWTLENDVTGLTMFAYSTDTNIQGNVELYTQGFGVGAVSAVTGTFSRVENEGLFVGQVNSYSGQNDANYGIYIAGPIAGGIENLAVYDTSGTDWVIESDNTGIFQGANRNVRSYFDGTDYITKAEIGTPQYKIQDFSMVNSTSIINTGQNFSVQGKQGLTKGVTIMKTAITTCDLNFTGGILTSTTC